MLWVLLPDERKRLGEASDLHSFPLPITVMETLLYSRHFAYIISSPQSKTVRLLTWLALFIYFFSIAGTNSLKTSKNNPSHIQRLSYRPKNSCYVEPTSESKSTNDGTDEV